MLIRIAEGQWIEPRRIFAVVVAEALEVPEGYARISDRVIVHYGRKTDRFAPVIIPFPSLTDAIWFADELGARIGQDHDAD